MKLSTRIHRELMKKGLIAFEPNSSEAALVEIKKVLEKEGLE